EAFQHWRRLIDAEPAFVGIAEGQRKPLLADRRLPAWLRRVRRNKRGVRQQRLPRAPDLDEIVAVGAVAVQKHDKLMRGARARLEARTVKLGHCRCAPPPPPQSERPRAACSSDSRTRACTLPRRARGAKLPPAVPFVSRSAAS